MELMDLLVGVASFGLLMGCVLVGSGLAVIACFVVGLYVDRGFWDLLFERVVV